MSKKKLNTSALMNELKGQSAFFKKAQPVESSPKEGAKSEPPDKHDAMPPVQHDTTVARYHDTTIETIRKAVREFGKEAATHRFTLEEKQAVADIIYAYKRQRIRTSENEIARIAINFIVQDYKQNGKHSVLDRALKALND